MKRTLTADDRRVLGVLLHIGQQHVAALVEIETAVQTLLALGPHEDDGPVMDAVFNGASADVLLAQLQITVEADTCH